MFEIICTLIGIGVVVACILFFIYVLYKEIKNGTTIPI